MDLFAKGSAIINTKISFKNYKKRTRRNWSQSKNGTDLFQDDENASAEKNNEIILDSDYHSENMLKAIYLVVPSLNCT